MRPAEKKLQRFIWMWAAVLTAFSLVMSTGSTYSRLIDWTSAELIYVPSETTGYSSDCLTAVGQQILLSDWQPEETQRTIQILISRPVTEAPEDNTENTDPDEMPGVGENTEDTETGETPTEGENTEDTETGETPTEGENTEDTETGETPNEGENTENTDPGETPNAGENTEDTETGETPTEGENTEDTETGETPNEGENTEDTETGEVPNAGENTEDTETGETPTEGENTEDTENGETPPEGENTEDTETGETPTGGENTEDTETGETPNEGENTENTDPGETPEQGENTEDTETVDRTSEVTITLDEVASAHLSSTVQVGEDAIVLVLNRVENAPGLAQTTTMTVQIEWFGLKGTVCVDMLPYGDDAVETIDTEDDDRVVTGLEPVRINDTINRENPVACVKLNLQTLADFSLSFTCNGSALNRVLWSLDGESYTLLYDSNKLTIAWPYPENWDGTLYLDFSDALQTGQQPTIAVETTGYARYEASPYPQSLPEASGLILKAAGLPHTIAITPKWGDAVLQIVQIERLVADETGALTYQPDTSLTAAVTDTGILLTATQAELYPPSGSYRLIAQWIWNETVVEQQIIYFFVNTN